MPETEIISAGFLVCVIFMFGEALACVGGRQRVVGRGGRLKLQCARRRRDVNRLGLVGGEVLEQGASAWNRTAQGEEQ
jgi:hypothetical protein